jgi:metal-responsive CopG/Arc/MetJ family transcriptional regulator
MRKEQSLGDGYSLPRKKSEIKHKKSISVTITPENVQEINTRFDEWGYRSVSHLVDDAVSRLIKLKKKGYSDSNEN